MQNDNNGGMVGMWMGTVSTVAAWASSALEIASGIAAALLPILGLITGITTLLYTISKWRKERRNSQKSTTETL